MRIGIDLGGTKIEAIALGATGAILARERIPSPRGEYRATVEALAGIALRVAEQAGHRGALPPPIGIGIPGTISPATGLIKNANSVWLIGHPLDRDLEAILGRPVRLANDANCFALSEAADGAAAGKEVVYGVILGTGCGSGIVVGGRAIGGLNAIAGEWGHNALPWPRPEELPGPDCYCGLKGCTESWISGPGFEADFKRAAGLDMSAPDIAALADSGDAMAEAAMQRLEDRIARALSSVINILDPDIVVFGGGLSNIDRLYGNVAALLPRHVFSDTVVTPLVKNHHGDSSGVRGAAWLWSPDET